MSPESTLLHALSREVAEAHRGLPGACAAMVTGSVARGQADGISDIDMAIYYEGPLPDDPALGRVCDGLGGLDRRPLGGPRQEQVCIEAFELAGVEVQLIHSTVGAWEETMDELLVRHAVDTPLAKALEGISVCRPFYGESLINAWKARAAAFPPALAEVMVRRYLAFFPLWGVPGQILSRDATIWYHQILVEGAQNLLGVLSGLNHVYYTPFQFKRMASFCAKLPLAPPRLAARLEGLFALGPADGPRALEALVSETVDLVEQHMPTIDTSALRRRLGWRKPAWSPVVVETRLAAAR